MRTTKVKRLDAKSQKGSQTITKDQVINNKHRQNQQSREEVRSIYSNFATVGIFGIGAGVESKRSESSR